MQDLQQLVDQADHAALLIAVDGLCAGRQWDVLSDLARRCREAVEMGRQLWGVATHIDYRLAWEGPASYAGGVLRPGAGRFALGPLTEVAAAEHDWRSIAPHISDPVSRYAVAQERVLRGEDLRGDPVAEEAAAIVEDGLPLYLVDWEPRYALPVYRDRSAKFPQPVVATQPLPPPVELSGGETLTDDPAAQALRDLVEPWRSESGGEVHAVCVRGDGMAAVGALSAEASLLGIEPGDGAALMQWAGASGGAHGRRRGGAAGRFAAWWAASALAGLEWPPDPEELGEAVGELGWWRWRPPEPELGWVLRLAVADPGDGLAWAVDALDVDDEAVSDPSTAADASAGKR